VQFKSAVHVKKRKRKHQHAGFIRIITSLSYRRYRRGERDSSDERYPEDRYPRKNTKLTKDPINSLPNYSLVKHNILVTTHRSYLNISTLSKTVNKSQLTAHSAQKIQIRSVVMGALPTRL